MAVTVRNVLNLPSFKNAKLLTSQSWLGNEVTQVSIADSPITDADYMISKPGDFYLSEFYFAKESIEKMYEFFDIFIHTSSSGLCILDEYIKELPAEIIQYCDEHRIPVLINSVDVPYALMIREIMELIIADGQNMLLEKELTAIIDDALDRKNKLKILESINPHFKSSLTALYIHLNEGQDKVSNIICDIFNRDILCSCLPFRNGLLSIVSYPESNDGKAAAKIEYFTNKLQEFEEVVSVGISDNNIPLNESSRAFNQALAAADSGFNGVDGSIIHYYNNLGILRLLTLLAGSAELEEYYHSIMDPLLEYDKKTNSQIYNTMLVYYNNHYNYKSTAKALFIHENTVRYRINKVQEILTSKSPSDDFRESFSIALKCKSIIEKHNY